MRAGCILIVCLLSYQLLVGQVTISGGFAQDSVVIGDNVEFTISLEVDPGVDILAIPKFFVDSIYGALQSVKARTDTSEPIIPIVADFELISTGGFEDLNEDGMYTADEMNWEVSSVGSQRLFQNSFVVKLWDPGENIVVYPPVIYQKDGVQDQYIAEEQMKVIVIPPRGLPATQDSLDLAPIKNIKIEKTKLSDFLIYFILIGLALAIGLIYWLYTKYIQRKELLLDEVEEEVIYIPPHILALEKLTELKSQQLWQVGEIKKYQSELTHIVREYLEGRYGVHALESTTEEVIKDLVNQLIEVKDVNAVKRILQVADLVKFAKAKPDENIHESFMIEAIDFVERTKLENIEEKADD